MHSSRRDFILLSSTIGLASLFDTSALASIMKNNGFGDREYRGQLRSYVEQLLKKCDSGELSSSGFTNLLKRRFDDFDIENEFSHWINQGPNQNSDRVVYKFRDEKRKTMMLLFFISPGTSHPPHAHHDLMSCQTLLSGELELKQYDRVEKIENGLKVKKTNDRIILPGDKIMMTEWNNNIHWFGSRAKPSLVLNCHATGIPDKTFESKDSRNSARYFIDPTKGTQSGDFIVAPEISRDEAHQKFAKHTPRFFD